MTDKGVFKWHRRDEDNIRWVKSKAIRMLLEMNPDIDSLLVETGKRVISIKGGTYALRESILSMEREIS